MFSDSSQTFLSASSYAFYPFHIALLTFTKSTSRKQAMSDSTSIVYLTFAYSNSKEITASKNNRVQAINSLHICASCVTKPLADTAVRLFLCRIMYKSSLILLMTVVSYVVDIPESEDIFSIK